MARRRSTDGTPGGTRVTVGERHVATFGFGASRESEKSSASTGWELAPHLLAPSPWG